MAIHSLWKVVYVFHFDLGSDMYYAALKIGCLFLLVYQLKLKIDLPRIYVKSVEWFSVMALSFDIVLLTTIVLQELIKEYIMFELLPLLALLSLLLGGILISRKSNSLNHLLSLDNRDHGNFTKEPEMQVYVSLLFE